MSNPWTTMQTAFWNYLNAQAAYTALGLNEYRAYDGNIVPIDIEPLLHGDRLPLIAARTGAMGHEREMEGQYVEYVTLQIAVMFRAHESGNTSAPLENAVNVILSAVNTRAARGSNLGTSTIGQYELVPREIIPLLTNGSAPVRAWFWTATLTLRGPRRIHL